MRPLLAGLLIVILAWPPSVCFCHQAHDGAGAVSTTDTDGEHDDHEDEDDCTCCKRRQVLADPTLPATPDNFAAAWADLPWVSVGIDAPTVPLRPVACFPIAATPSLEMLCALRI